MNWYIMNRSYNHKRMVAGGDWSDNPGIWVRFETEYDAMDYVTAKARDETNCVIIKNTGGGWTEAWLMLPCT